MSVFLLHGTPLFKKNMLLNANFVITCCSFFICTFIAEKRANVVYPKIFDVFVSDWLKFLINIQNNQNSNPRRKSSTSSYCEDVSQVVKVYGAQERQRGRLWEDVPPPRKSRPTTSTEGKSRLKKK